MPLVNVKMGVLQDISERNVTQNVGTVGMEKTVALHVVIVKMVPHVGRQMDTVSQAAMLGMEETLALTISNSPEPWCMTVRKWQ